MNRRRNPRQHPQLVEAQGRQIVLAAVLAAAEQTLAGAGSLAWSHNYYDCFVGCGRNQVSAKPASGRFRFCAYVTRGVTCSAELPAAPKHHTITPLFSNPYHNRRRGQHGNSRTCIWAGHYCVTCCTKRYVQLVAFCLIISVDFRCGNSKIEKHHG